MDYGGPTYDVSFFNIVELDDQLKELKKETLYWGDFKMSSENLYPVVDMNNL